MDAGLDDQARGGRAALAGREKGALHRAFDGDLEVGVIQHDERVLAAHFELDLLHRVAGDAGGRDLAAGRDRAGEGDRVHVLVLEQCLADDRAAAHHQVEHALGQAGALDDVDQRPGRPGDEVGRLDHDAVAVGERRGDLPGRDGDREIPGRDHADDADRLAGDLDADAGTHGRDALAIQAQALAGEEGEDLAGAGGLADAFRQGLAFLARQQAAELVLAGEDLVGGLLQDFVALLRGGAAPGREGSLGGGDRIVQVLNGALRILADDVVGVGRVDVARGVLRAGPFTGDQVLEGSIHRETSCLTELAYRRRSRS